MKDIKGNLEEILDDYIRLDISIVKEAVKSLKHRRAVGIGDVPAELLKNGTNNLYELLRCLFEKCLKG